MERIIEHGSPIDDAIAIARQIAVVVALFAWLRFAAEERHNWPAKAA